MRWLRFSLLILAVAVLQASSLLNFIAVTDLRIKPDLLLIVMFFCATNCDTYSAVITSFAIGFAADIIGPSMGPYFLSFGIVGSALAHVRRIILLRKTRDQAAAILLVSIITAVLARFFALFKDQNMPPNSVFVLIAVAVYSAILWFLIRWFVVAAGKWMGIGVHRFGAGVNR